MSDDNFRMVWFKAKKYLHTYETSEKSQVTFLLECV